MANDDIRFIDHDPVIDVIKGELQRFGGLGHENLARHARDSGISVTTLVNWMTGVTKRPQNLTTRFVLQDLGITIQYIRGDGTKIRQPGMVEIPKAEQEKILRHEREKEKERKEKREAKQAEMDLPEGNIKNNFKTKRGMRR